MAGRAAARSGVSRRELSARHPVAHGCNSHRIPIRSARDPHHLLLTGPVLSRRPLQAREHPLKKVVVRKSPGGPSGQGFYGR